MIAGARSTARSADGTRIPFESFGEGEDIIVVGGALSSARTYVPLARALAKAFAVHVIERRGRNGSAPQGPNYAIDQEIDDLLAVQAATAARAVFGHSYGGLIALEAARRSDAFSGVVVYEPGVSINRSIPIDWMLPYRRMLAAGDGRGAFAAMVRGGGGRPPRCADCRCRACG
jgi:pimeloyl-ACP methyl ester carboxylesterase